ncbi:kinase-associated lipoprotein B [Bacillus sp. S/N-304-OC-R1]|uniref:kinase-associated lipoprotein B n=1 Tax=Bacillus sp. S/N-304-OC-R1 TaxID=2758034 RepID=UPI001C8DF62D|nr:kinase-associated lipoprotein B [Bacillus sp. S/N-304-OC-R1]MBY0124292.1 kinase-associated lipoprotein B [Bacillus sp. S/N-304-OC-R1]
MADLQIGNKVTAIYKTGKYIGEITDIRAQHYLVRVLAVIKHPMQGDLHNPKDANVQMFHERRALAYREQTNVPKQMVKLFDGNIPEYTASLREALDKMMQELKEDGSPWAELSLKNAEVLEMDYFK